MNPRVLLRSPGFLPERQLLKSSTQSLTSHLARPPSLNFQKSFLFVASSPSGNNGRRAFSSSSAGRFIDGEGGAVGGGSGGECRKGDEEVEGVGEGGEKGWSCGEEDGNEGDGRGSEEYKGGDVSSDNGSRELQGSSDVGTLTPWYHEGIGQSPAKRPPEPSVTTKGKLLPTPSRLLKLLLPLKLAGSPIDSPLTLLVHPQQPLSYLERLIQAELPPITSPDSTPRPPNISFKALNLGNAPPEAQINIGSEKGLQPLRGEEGEGGVEINRGLGSLNPSERPGEGGYVCWSTSTEVGDFIRSVARGKEFVIQVEGRDGVPVGMPSFKQRTHYLRQRLVAVMREIELQVRLKSECDRIARRGAQRVAVSGFLGLVGCLTAVCWLTFKASLGWAVMEPMTYLVGLSTVVSGYLLLLYNNRQVLSKRQKLYREKGFDMDEWEELVYEGKALRREIRAIAEEHDVGWDERSDKIGGDKVVILSNEGERDGG
ncbi:hypothetical protein B9Z19DRAFT_581012 [Tuber borchii]|uniref:Calcium uniporter protein n=1 Tax=Tuber borchii TaxID=42251 RepID=A0A2T7A1N1_TUBBO|nr:hypothetical protein B9Z19DRAFT_581012 [Tuber borchii]